MIHTLRLLKRVLKNKDKRGRVLFVGQAYYNAWYLSRELQKLHWAADLINFDENPDSKMYYHGEDFLFQTRSIFERIDQILFFFIASFYYQIFSFANVNGLKFGNAVPRFFLFRIFGKGSEIKFLKFLNRKIVYGNNGCNDGVSQSAFSAWGPSNVCSICSHRNNPLVCTDHLNLAWGKLRNSLVDYQCLLGGNRADYNLTTNAHESPFYYCLDKNFWRPNLLIPSNYLLPVSKSSIKLYHAVGNFDARTSSAKDSATIKSTHIYLPLVERLKNDGFDVELLFFKDVPNKVLRYYQAQSDIFLDMLTFGFFGASVREAMMLGKPAICFLRPEWLDSMRREIPEYVDELPVISATPETVYDILKDLIENPYKRIEIGRKSRLFAEKWHASDVAAQHFDSLFQKIILESKSN